MPSKKKATQSADESGNDDYLKKRERNNIAVKKCREKNNERAKEVKERLQKLKDENTKLEVDIERLKQNVGYLKDLLLRKVTDEKQIDKILAEEDSS